MSALVVIAVVLGQSISMHEARAAANSSAPDVVRAQQRLETAQADVGIARTWANPNLSVSTSSQTAKLGASLSVPLPIFGQVGVAAAAAEADLETFRHDTEVTARDARWAATMAWLDLWEAGARAELLERSAQDATRFATIAAEKYEAGKGPRLDVLRTGGERDRAKADAIAARETEHAASARLSTLLGPVVSELKAAGSPTFLMAPAVEERRLIENHPVLIRDRADIVAAEARVRLEERLRWPIVAAQLTVNAFDPTLPGPDIQAGVAFDLPLFNRRGASIQRARSLQHIAEMNAELDARRMRSAIADAAARSRGAAVQLESLSTSVVPALLEARSLTVEAFQLGTLDVLRVLDAQRAISDARIAEVTARSTWARAVADLERAAGANLEGGSDAK